MSRRSKRKAAAAARPDGASKRKKQKAKAAVADEADKNELRMTLTEHLAELRSRIIKSVLAIALGALLVFTFWNQILAFLRRPYDQFCTTLKGQQACQFLATDPLGPISARMGVAGWGGLVVALPVVLWQLWRFVVPGLHAKEKKYAAPFIVSSVLLFALGAAIAYWLLAKSLQFLIAWGGPGFTVAFSIVGIAFGALLSLSRTVYAGYLTPEQKGEMFGFYTTFERSASLLGPLLWGLQVWGLAPLGPARYRIAMASMNLFVGASLIILCRSIRGHPNDSNGS